MKSLLFSLLFLLSASAFDCARYFTFAPQEVWIHHDEKILVSNFWEKRFSASRFVRKNKALPWKKFFDDMFSLKGHNDHFEKNARSLLSHLRESDKITSAVYEGALKKLGASPKKRALIQNILKKTSPQARTRTKDALRGSKMFNSQLELLSKKLDSIKKPLDHSLWEDYLRYLNTLEYKQIPGGIAVLESALSGGGKGKILRNFRRYQKRAAAFEESLVKNYAKKRPEYSAKRTQREIARKSENYKKLSLSCRNKHYMSSDAVKAEKKFTRFVTGVATASTAAGFYFAHKDEKKNADWFKRFGYEMVFSAFFSWMSAKVSIKPEYSFLKKLAVSIGISAGFDTGDAVLYETLLGENKKGLEKKLKDGSFKELYAAFEKEKLDEKFLEQFEEHFSFRGGEDGKISIDDSAYQDDILKYAANLAEKENMSDWISESEGMQRFIFHRGWDLVSIPKNIILGMAVYRTFCMSTINPQKAYLTAASLIVANSLFETFVYFPLRKKTIDQ